MKTVPNFDCFSNASCNSLSKKNPFFFQTQYLVKSTKSSLLLHKTKRK